MGILIGVQFLFAKSLICKASSILFNDIRLCGTPKTVAAELFAFSPITPFNERSRGVHFRQKGCAHFNYSSRAQKKGRKTRSPKNANDLATLYSHKIRDLCTAFEVEYELREKEFATHKPKKLIEALKETIKVYKRDHPGELSEDIYNSAFNSVGFISLPAREKIWAIYSQFRDVIDTGFKQMSLFSNMTFDFSEEKTREDIKWLVKLRNSITHSSTVTEQDIPNAIYSRLRVAVYCSIFTRAGYSSSEIAAIVNAYFNGGYTA